MRSVPAFLFGFLTLATLPWTAVAGAADVAPHWIWGTVDRQPGQSVHLQRSFDATAPIVSARLHLAADFARCDLQLNGETLVELDEYGPWIELDVTEKLRVGQNTISLKCLSGEGPAAIAFSLQSQQSDGKGVVVVSDTEWKTARASAVSLGRVAPEFWQVGDIARVSSFDDYEQWRQATGAEQGTDPATFVTQPGFEVALVRTAQPDEGSWVAMAVDPQGRVTIGREDKGLLRMTLTGDGRGVERVETIDDTLLETRGLLYAHGMLYANANNSMGLYRLRDTNGDDQFDEVKLLRKFPGGKGHGRNSLALGPDGMIYSIHGDSVDLPTEDVRDLTSPYRAARRNQKTTEGALLRTDKDGKRWELVAAGLRNPFGVDFNTHGEAFTYDADAEFDMGSPWYRPTRIDQLTSGADFGWRGLTGKWPPYFPDHADNSLPVVNVGKGSPTAVKSGQKSSFPEHYRKAMFALDWTYGRILACHLSPRGAGYVCRVEQFLKGRPLNVTSLDFGPDGSLYVVTGGRKTQSALYRVSYRQPLPDLPPLTVQQQARGEFSAKARQLNRKLAEFHAIHHPDAVPTTWPYLASQDPVIRHTARMAVEHQPTGEWAELAMVQENSETAAYAFLAHARSWERASLFEFLRRANARDVTALSSHARLALIHAYRLCLDGWDDLDEKTVTAAHTRLLDWLKIASKTGMASTGAGDGVRRELSRLVADLQLEGAVPLLMNLLRDSSTQRERMQALFLLRNQKSGWTLDDRQLFFEALRELEVTAFSGQGMPGFLAQIRSEATALLSEADREELAELLQPVKVNEVESLTIERPLVRKWTVEELAEAVRDISRPADVARGETLFREVRCSACHRMQGRGGVIGPDLTSVAGRFSRRDMLTSILKPSLVIADKYRGTQVVTDGGKVFNGRVVTGGDYRQSVLRIVEDSLQPGKITEIPKSDIEVHQPSKASPMPEGLLDTLTAEEVLDLLAYLSSRDAVARR